MSEMTRFPRWAAIGSVALLGACTVMPTGPSVMVLPGTGQPFERFRADDVDCRNYAHYQIGGKTAGDAGKESAVTSAAVGTAVGALAGLPLVATAKVRLLVRVLAC